MGHPSWARAYPQPEGGDRISPARLIKATTVVLAAVCLYLSTGVQVLAATPTQPRPNRAPTAPAQLWRACSNANVLPCIDYAAWRWHQSDAVMRLVARRESTDNPSVSNGADIGLFQIQWYAWPEKSTWAWAPNGVPENPYWRQSPWSARYNALTAAWLWHKGETALWSTYP